MRMPPSQPLALQWRPVPPFSPEGCRDRCRQVLARRLFISPIGLSAILTTLSPHPRPLLSHAVGDTQRTAYRKRGWPQCVARERLLDQRWQRRQSSSLYASVLSNRKNLWLERRKLKAVESALDISGNSLSCCSVDAAHDHDRRRCPYVSSLTIACVIGSCNQ